MDNTNGIELGKVNWEFGKECIYKITIGGKLSYIGQTRTGYTRIYQHFRAAYETLDDSDGPAAKMRKNRVEEIQIEVWDSAPWGFPQDVYNSFREKFLMKGENSNDSKAIYYGTNGYTDLDIGEMMHIMRGAIRGDAAQYNTQMGGQVPSANLVVGGVSHPRVIMRTMSPREGYAALANSAAGDISTIIKNIQNNIFSPHWPEIYQKSYKKQVNRDLTAAEAETWEHYFKNKVVPALSELVTQQLKIELQKDAGKVKSINKARVTAQKKNSRLQVSNGLTIVIKKFLDNKADIFNDILNNLYGNISKNNGVKPTLKGEFNSDGMAHYLAARVSSIVWKKGGGIRSLTDWDYKNNSRLELEGMGSEGGDYVRRWTVAVDFKRPDAPEWLKKITTSSLIPGKSVSKDFLIRMSFIIFNYYVNQVKNKKDISPSMYGGFLVPQEAVNSSGGVFITDLKMIHTDDKAPIENRDKVPKGSIPFVTPYSMKYEDSLSSRIRQAYLSAGINGYKGRWIEFYQWMIDRWRAYHHAPVMQYLSTTDTNHAKPIAYYVYENIYYIYRFAKPNIGTLPTIY